MAPSTAAAASSAAAPASAARRRTRPAARGDLDLRLERSVLPEDRLLQTLQRRARLDPELVHEHAPRPLICVECLRLPAGPVEREHQLSAQPLAQGVLGDKRLQLGDQVAMAAEREVGFDPLLECRQPELLQPRDLDLGERVVRELRQRRAAPERERLAQLAAASSARPAAERPSSLLEQGLEPMEVELAVGDRQHVAVGTGQEDAVLTWFSVLCRRARSRASGAASR